MPILGNRLYSGTIHRAKFEKLEKQDGGVTRFLKVRIQVVNEGFIDHSLYLTPNAIAQTKKVLSELNPNIWDGTYPFLLREPEKFLKDMPCRIETETHVFENARGIEDRSVRVKWLNGVTQGAAAGDDDAATVLAMMGIEDTFVAPEPSQPDTGPVPEPVLAGDDTPV